MQEEVYTNSVKCQELAKEKQQTKAELEELYENGKNWLNKPVLPIFPVRDTPFMHSLLFL